MRILAATALALATVASPAFAQDEEAASFTGPTVAVMGGFDHVGDGTDDGKGFVFGAALGYDVQVKNFVLGGEVEATLSTTEQCAGVTCVEAGRDLYAGLRAGVVAAPGTLVYVKGGYTNARAELTSNGSTLGTDDLDGVRVGAGVEHGLTSGALVRVEYRYSNYEQNVSRHQGMLSLGYRF